MSPPTGISTVVVDDASTDSTRPALAALAPTAREPARPRIAGRNSGVNWRDSVRVPINLLRSFAIAGRIGAVRPAGPTISPGQRT